MNEIVLSEECDEGGYTIHFDPFRLAMQDVDPDTRPKAAIPKLFRVLLKRRLYRTRTTVISFP